jgi:hypothetical protein
MEGFVQKQLDQKYIGGICKFLNITSFTARFVDTTDLDISVWISDMNKVTPNASTHIYFYVEIYDAGMSTTFTVPLFRGVASKAINGFNIPRKVYDLGFPRQIIAINIIAWNSLVSDNHEFFFWWRPSASQCISLRSE